MQQPVIGSSFGNTSGMSTSRSTVRTLPLRTSRLHKQFRSRVLEVDPVTHMARLPGSPPPRHAGAQRHTPQESYMLMHPVYEKEYLERLQPKHQPPKQVNQVVGFYVIQAVRTLFDFATGYGPCMDEQSWLRRFIFLETVAGVPGMVAAMVRHLSSLRGLDRDHGWIHTLLEEAENERMHLLTFIELRRPGFLFRGMVLLTQALVFNAYFLAYLLHPPTCHAFVAYLEEEAVKTYTHAIQEIDDGKLEAWKSAAAPLIAINYWKLDKAATVRDLILAVRADEACHAHVNHTFALMDAKETNPFSVGNHQVE